MNRLSVLAFILAFAAAPVVLAQTEQTEEPLPPAGQELPEGQFDETVPGRAYDVPSQVGAEISERMGPEQTELELVQTTLPNRFAELGFARLNDIAKENEIYVASVTMVRGEQVLVEINPYTGEISACR